MLHDHRKEKPCPLNSVMETSELLCQGYVVYWCYAINIHPKERKKAEDILIVCEFRDVFLKSYRDCPTEEN